MFDRHEASDKMRGDQIKSFVVKMLIQVCPVINGTVQIGQLLSGDVRHLF